MTLSHRSLSHGVPEPGTLASKRLVLRAPRPTDAKPLATLINDRRIAENTARIPHPYGVKDAHAFIAEIAGRSVDHASREPTFLITLAADGTIIGGCGVAQLGAGDPELGYWIGVPYWGRGYATEAARAVIDYGFGELRYERLAGRARVSNPASRRVLEKCGFQWTGVSLIRIRALASSAPADCFRLDRGLWASLRSWGEED
jgi:RimJ/RimL family protein N-acetyltransferase